MLNKFMLLGRITRIEQGKVMVAIPRPYKNELGIYDTDIVSITIKENIDETIREYCRKDDLIGIQGNIACLDSNLELVAEKVTFLSSKKGSVENGNE